MSPSGPRPLVALIVAAAVVWHVLVALAPPAPPLAKSVRGQQLALVRTATAAATAGEDPYARPARKPKAARLPRNPATLLFTAWLPALSPTQAVVVWWVLGELALLLTVVLLWRAWRPDAEAAAPALALAAASSFGVGHAQLLGHDVLLAVGLLVVADTAVRRLSFAAQIAAGTALGVALPLTLPAWGLLALWIAQRRTVAAASAVAAGSGVAVASIAVVGTAAWSTWTTLVLPGVLDGTWFGPAAAAFGNHGLPGLLPLPAAVTAPVLGLLSYASAAVLFRTPTADVLTAGARLGALLSLGAIVPTVAPDPNLALALPATALAATAVVAGRLSPPWAAGIGLAWAVLAVPTPHLEQLATKVLTAPGPGAIAVQWLPTVAVLVVTFACGWVGRGKLST